MNNMNSHKTKRLFYNAPYKKEFEATVISSLKIDDTSCGIILDQTLFYPESGGQPADKGRLNKARVYSVYEDDETIVHVVDTDFNEGEKVHGSLDWDRRFDHMQQHSGQHILSQSFLELKNAKTIGFHMGEKDSTIDIDCADISDEEIQLIEDRANKIVMENRDIQISVIDKNKLDTAALRKYPSEEDTLRIVEIDHFDKTACCGTHVLRTGEIGIIKIIKTENYKGGKRITFTCGWRSIKDYQFKHTIVNKAAKILTSSCSELLDNIEKLKNKYHNDKKRVNQLIKEKADLESRDLFNNAEKLHGMRIASQVFRNREQSEVSVLIKQLIDYEKIIVIFGLEDQEPMIFLGRSEDVDIDMRKILQPASEIMQAKGGGSPFLAQAKGKLSGKTDEAVKKAIELVKKNINNL